MKTNNKNTEFTNKDIKQFLKEIKIKKASSQDIDELTNLIENCNNDNEEICLKLLYYSKYDNSCNDLSYLIEIFDLIKNGYFIYKNFSKGEDWVECYNEKYKYIDITKIEDIIINFDYTLKEQYLKDMIATCGIDDKTSDKLYNMELKDIIYKFNEMGILYCLNIESYLDWKTKVNELRAEGLFIDTIKNYVIVFNC